jgi:hypothetical protein
MIDPDDETPEQQAEDERASREGFNPLFAVILIVLIGAAVYLVSAWLA